MARLQTGNMPLPEPFIGENVCIITQCVNAREGQEYSGNI